MPSSTDQPFLWPGSVSLHPSRSLPLNRVIGWPNLTLARSGLGGRGGIRLPVNGSRLTPLPSVCGRICVSSRSSPEALATIVSVKVCLRTTLPCGVLALHVWSRVTTRVSLSRQTLSTGTTLPPPQRIGGVQVPVLLRDAQPACAAAWDGQRPASDVGIGGFGGSHRRTQDPHAHDDR